MSKETAPTLLLMLLLSVLFAAMTTPVHARPASSSTILAQTMNCSKSGPERQYVLGAKFLLAQQQYTMNGKIRFIEKDGTLILQTKDKSERVVYIDDSTKISRNGEPATLSDLRPGDQVQAIVGSMRKALEFKADGP